MTAIESARREIAIITAQLDAVECALSHDGAVKPGDFGTPLLLEQLRTEVPSLARYLHSESVNMAKARTAWDAEAHERIHFATGLDELALERGIEDIMRMALNG